MTPRLNGFPLFRSPAPGATEDTWTSDRPTPENERSGGYDGPAGMEPDGIIESNWDEVTENFDDMALREELLRGVYAYGFEKPSAIQQRAIVPCVKGHDVIAQAQSGTGKTATFSISILQQIETKKESCQALVLAPTRELAQQTRKVVIALGDYMGAQCHACIGGTSVKEDMRKLEAGQHIVVGKSCIFDDAKSASWYLPPALSSSQQLGRKVVREKQPGLASLVVQLPCFTTWFFCPAQSIN